MFSGLQETSAGVCYEFISRRSVGSFVIPSVGPQAEGNGAPWLEERELGGDHVTAPISWFLATGARGAVLSARGPRRPQSIRGRAAIIPAEAGDR